MNSPHPLNWTKRLKGKNCYLTIYIIKITEISCLLSVLQVSIEAYSSLENHDRNSRVIGKALEGSGARIESLQRVQRGYAVGVETCNIYSRRPGNLLSHLAHNASQQNTLCFFHLMSLFSSNHKPLFYNKTVLKTKLRRFHKLLFPIRFSMVSLCDMF